MEFSECEALIFTEFFRRKPIFFRGKPTFFMEVFGSECNFSQSSVVRRKGKSSNGEGDRYLMQQSILVHLLTVNMKNCLAPKI